MTYKATLDPLLPALRIAYGKDVMELLRAQYRSGRVTGDLPRTLRQGVRIGFGMMEVAAITSVAVELGIKAEIANLAAEAIDRARRQRVDASPTEQSRSLDVPRPPLEPAVKGHPNFPSYGHRKFPTRVNSSLTLLRPARVQL